MHERGGVPQLDIYRNFQVQYLLQFYQQNLKIMTKPFTGLL